MQTINSPIGRIGGILDPASIDKLPQIPEYYRELLIADCGESIACIDSVEERF